MKKSRATAPYKPDGSATFPMRGKAGAYLIYERGELAYVGHSKSDLYTAMYRHFQKWRDNTQVRVTYNRDKCTVRVVYTTPAQAERIVKHKPKDNPNKLLNYQLSAEDVKAFRSYEDEDVSPIHTFNEAPF